MARYGGEEFAIVLPEADLKGALHLADEMRAKVESLAIRYEKIVVSVGRGVVTISLGVATLIPHSQSTPERLVSLADKALYMAKEEGRNRVKTALRQEENI